MTTEERNDGFFADQNPEFLENCGRHKRVDAAESKVSDHDDSDKDSGDSDWAEDEDWFECIGMEEVGGEEESDESDEEERNRASELISDHYDAIHLSDYLAFSPLASALEKACDSDKGKAPTDGHYWEPVNGHRSQRESYMAARTLDNYGSPIVFDGKTPDDQPASVSVNPVGPVEPRDTPYPQEFNALDIIPRDITESEDFGLTPITLLRPRLLAMVFLSEDDSALREIAGFAKKNRCPVSITRLPASDPMSVSREVARLKALFILPPTAMEIPDLAKLSDYKDPMFTTDTSGKPIFRANFVSSGLSVIHHDSPSVALQKVNLKGRTCRMTIEKWTKEDEAAFAKRIACDRHESVFESVYVSFMFYFSRGISAQLLRHRLLTAGHESTRGVDYKNCITFVIPMDVEDNGVYAALFRKFVFTHLTSYVNYVDSRSSSAIKSTARDALSLGLGANCEVTANLREWIYIANLRSAPGAHSEIRHLAKTIGAFLSEKYPWISKMLSEHANPDKVLTCNER